MYPWVFEHRDLPASPLYILLHSWDLDLSSRRSLFDVAVNIAIYIPLGMSAFLALQRFQSRTLKIVGPIVLGTVLSAAIEMAQLFTPHRVCSTVDLATNILGSALGVLAGFVFVRTVDAPTIDFRVRDKRSVALLFCWVAFLLFPFFPDLSLVTLEARFGAFVHAPLLTPIPMLLATAEWFAAGCLLSAAGASSPISWLCALLLLVPAQFAIVNRSPMPPDLFGAMLGAMLFVFARRKRHLDFFAGVALLIALTLRGLAPFRFEGPPHAFSWIPFEGLLGTQWQDGIPILLGKLFQYGASIWLLHRGGLGIFRATAIVTVVLAAIEALQTRIPGHVPEINDPLLALLLYVGFLALKRNSRG